jgi:stress response protein YsnF
VETARVTREPVNEPVDGAEVGEESIDVPLRGERPVVQKQTVAKERVGIETDVQTDREETVREELRKEHVEIEGDVDES